MSEKLNDIVKEGWVKLFHPSGVQVSLPVMPVSDHADALAVSKSYFDHVTIYLEAGFLVNAPGLEEGEQREEVGHVLRKMHEKDGETTNVVAVYSTNPALTWKVMHKYLNEDADQVDFERAAGIRLTDLPIYEGGDYPERGKATRTDKYIVKVPRPFFVVWKNNPKHVPAPPEGTKDTRTASQKMTKLFVRWETSGKAAPAEPEKPQAKAPSSKDIISWWSRFLGKDPGLNEVTDNWNRFCKTQPHEIIKEVEETAIDEWRGKTGCWYDRDAGKWMPPKEPDASDFAPF